MRLRNKILVVIGITLIALIGAFELVLERVLSAQFEILERNAVAQNVHRAEKALLDEVEQLSVKASDWAQWDDSYNFLEAKNDSYIDSNLTADSLAALRIEDVLYYDANGRYYYSAGESIGIADSEFEERQNVRQVIDRSPVLNRLTQSGQSRSGLLFSESGINLITARPIVPTDGEGEVRGTIIFSKVLSGRLIDKLSSDAEVDFALLRIDRLRQDTEAASVLPELQATGLPSNRIQDENTIRGFGLLNDIFGRPAVVVQTAEPRTLYQQGRITLKYLFCGLLICSAVVMSVLMSYLETSVISRLARMSAEIADVGAKSDSSRRVTADGNDELSLTGGEINRMLEALGRYEAELKTAKQAAEAANQARAQFVANISHEVRTPVNGIMGLTHVLLSIEQSPEKRDYLQMVKSSSDALMAVLNDVLDFSKLESGKVALESIPFSAAELLRTALPMMSVKAQERGLEILAQLAPDIPEALIGDPHRLRQVIVNLASNAVKFTDEGEVFIGAELESKTNATATLLWTVRDSGIGISEEARIRIFDAFVQAESSTTRKFGGTGLGLTISKQIVESMGGRIWVESVPGSGTTFFFTTPLGIGASEPKTTLEFPPGFSIALFDRSPGFLRQMSDHLKRVANVPLKAASQLPLAENIVEAGVSCGAIVIDGTLAEPETISSLLDSASLTNFRKIVTIPAQEAALGLRYRELGAEAVLLKPILPSDLASAITGHLRSELPETAEDSRPSRQLRILIADDLATNQRVLELLLKPFGHKVTSVSNGQEVLETLERTGYFHEGKTCEFDVILMDSNMPILDGTQTTQRIREREQSLHCGHLPIIAVSASALAGDRDRFLAEGMDDFVPKPVNPEELLRKLRSIPASSSSSAIHWQNLEQRFHNCIDFIDEIADLFRAEEPDLRNRLAAAVTQRDGEEIRKAAHAIKASLMNVGAERAAAVAQTLESRARMSEFTDIAPLFHRLCAEVDLAYSDLKKLSEH